MLRSCRNPGMRTCTDCGQTKLLDCFVRIKQRHSARYGRCRDCRNRRARERYHSTPEIRAAEIARAWRNKLRRGGRLLSIEVTCRAVPGPPNSCIPIADR
jgi:hypothetical protein